MKHKNVLVTGGAGLLGTELCKKLITNDIPVTALIRRKEDAIYSEVNYILADFSSDFQFKSLPDDVDTIIHLAQSAKFRDFPGGALDIFNVNIASTARLLDYAAVIGVKQFIYASSGGIYNQSELPLKECDEILDSGKLGPYLGSKVCSEILVKSYSSLFQTNILRPFFIYGETQESSMLIPRLINAVCEGKPIDLQGGNGLAINPIHVNDAASAILKLLDIQNSTTFNIAGPEVVTIKQICDNVGKLVDLRPQYRIQEGRSVYLVGDVTRMKEELHSPSLKLQIF
jgi:nucleoside-diphosphate-sugar epimerase